MALSTLSLSAGLQTSAAFIPLEKQEKAARCLQRACRRERCGLDLLRKGKDCIAELSHSQYELFCKKVQPLVQRGIKRTWRAIWVDMAADTCKNIRNSRQYSAYIPVCPNLRPGAEDSSFMLMTPEEVSELRLLRCGNIYLTEDAKKELSKMEKNVPKSEDDFDSLAQGLHQQRDLLPWQITARSCFARCQHAIDLLLLSAVPLQHIRKQYVVIPESLRDPDYDWSHHVAPLVTSLDGKISRILDPSFSPDIALTLLLWASFQLKAEIDFNSVEIVDLGHFDAACSNLKCTSEKGNQIFVFTSAPHLKFNEDHELAHYKEEDREYHWQLLAGDRVEVEANTEIIRR